MAHRLQQVLRQLHASLEALSDAQLLAQFVTARDDAAFAALVRRHGRIRQLRLDLHVKKRYDSNKK